MTLATDRPVLVTGATGYVASQLIADLLARGYKVRGTVRNLSREASHRHVRELPGAAERLELVEANLLDEGSFDLAAQGVDYVMHTASPYTLDVADPERDLVKPAEEGTLNVLRSCKRSSTVKRVVLTSSMAAVTDEPLSGKIYTEADWNGTSSLQRNPYFYSKARAERAAWAFVEDASVGYELVVIN
ncbi:MAG: NAD-dependent epimerase/dehydratase family protein, partial [Myxococcales bacterium]|nr:NAD-dependent epimerase/dehydratase family protein [Myxococcales bacterium]